jgi:hypothetical protein
MGPATVRRPIVCRTTTWAAAPCRRLPRSIAILVACVGGVLGSVLDARAVIIYSSTTPTRNTSASSSDQGLSAWNYEAFWGSFLATPIDPTHFIAAQHVGVPNPAQITIRDPSNPSHLMTYPVNAASEASDPGSDLCIFTLASGNSFPTNAYAPLYNAAVDGSEVGKTLTVIGRGTPPGAEVRVGGILKGWQWGSYDGAESWGQNIVTGFSRYNSVSATSVLYFDFDSNGIANEGSYSLDDSSGGVFINVGGQWKLAGINWSVSSPWSYTGDATDPGFNASIFDARGLYYKNAKNVWTPVPDVGLLVPGDSFASRISDRLSWIEGVLSQPVPEPGAFVLAGSGLLLTAILGWFRRRRQK